MVVERGRSSRVKLLGRAIGAALIVLAGVMVLRALTTRVYVQDYGEVTAYSRFGNGESISVRTRSVLQGEVLFWQLELAPATWVDCNGDCVETLRKQSVDFWMTRLNREH